MFFVYFIAAWVTASVAYYSLQRKLTLSERWTQSMRKAIREWDRDAALDAKRAVDEELVWTIVLIIAAMTWVIFVVAAVDAL